MSTSSPPLKKMKKKKKNHSTTNIELPLETSESSYVVSEATKHLYGFPFVPSKSQLEGYSLVRIRSRYISEDVRTAIEGKDVVVIKSPMGSGKTSFVLDMMKVNPRVLIVSPRRSFSDYMCTIVPDLVNYQNVEGQITATAYPRIVIQYQSLRRIKEIKKGTTYAQWDLVYIDEPNGVFGESVSETSKLSEREAFPEYLRKIVSSVKTVVLTDAGLAPWHLKIIDRHLLSNLSHRDKICVVNDFSTRNRTVTVFDECALSHRRYSRDYISLLKTTIGSECEAALDVETYFFSSSSASKELFLNELVEIYSSAAARMSGPDDTTDLGLYAHYLLASSPESNLEVICTTCNQALMFAAYFRLVLPVDENGNDPVSLMTSDTDPVTKRAFMENPRRFLKTKRCSIRTTCVSVGVDFNFKWSEDTLVVADYVSSSSTPRPIDIYQSVGRNRMSRRIGVYASDRRTITKSNAKSVEAKGNVVSEHFRNILLDEEQRRVVRQYPRFEGIPRDLNFVDLLDDNKTLVSDVNAVKKYEGLFAYNGRIFSDSLAGLLRSTIQLGDTRYAERLVDRDSAGRLDPNPFLVSKESVDAAKKTCGELFDSKVLKYTALTATTFSNLFYNDVDAGSRRDFLRSIAKVLPLFSGCLKSAVRVLRRIDSESLKKWAVYYGKIRNIDVDSPVDMMNYESEAEMIVDGKAILSEAKKTLYKNNQSVGIHSFEEFESVLESIDSLLDRRDGDYDDTKDISVLTKHLVCGYTIAVDKRDAMENIARFVGLTVKSYRNLDEIGGRETLRFELLPDDVENDRSLYKFDINRLTAMLMLK